MERILNIKEAPLTPKSMNTFGFPADGGSSPAAVASDDDEREAVRPLVSSAHASRAFEYYALEPHERTPALYAQGCAHVSRVVNELYESLVLDTTWSEGSRELFEAVNCGNVVSRERMEGKPRLSDLCRRNQRVLVRAEDLVVLTVRANAKLYWDREKELHAYASGRQVRYTADDPGPYLEYERRFSEAADDDVMGSVDVVVRKLVDGDAVRETVRVVQKFVVEATFQSQMIQALYELCVWHFVIQAKEVGTWQAAKDRARFVERWTRRLNKKVELVRMLSKISLRDYAVSTSGQMDAMNEKPKRVKAPTKFDRFYAEKRHQGVKLTKKELKVQFDALSEDEKLAYANAPPGAKPTAKRGSLAADAADDVFADADDAFDDEDPFAFDPVAPPQSKKKRKSVEDDDADDEDDEDDEDEDVDDVEDDVALFAGADDDEDDIEDEDEDEEDDDFDVENPDDDEEEEEVVDDADDDDDDEPSADARLAAVPAKPPSTKAKPKLPAAELPVAKPPLAKPPVAKPTVDKLKPPVARPKAHDAKRVKLSDAPAAPPKRADEKPKAIGAPPAPPAAPKPVWKEYFGGNPADKQQTTPAPAKAKPARPKPLAVPEVAVAAPSAPSAPRAPAAKGKLPLVKAPKPAVDDPEEGPDREIVQELVRDSKEHFLWELFSHNMNAMITARKTFTPFENTVFETAHAEWLKRTDEASDDARFRAAKKQLIKIPGIVHCFHMFNLLFKPDVAEPDEDEEEFLLG